MNKKIHEREKIHVPLQYKQSHRFLLINHVYYAINVFIIRWLFLWYRYFIMSLKQFKTNGLFKMFHVFIVRLTLTVTTKEASTVALFSGVNSAGVAVRPVVVLILTGFNRIRSPQPVRDTERFCLS